MASEVRDFTKPNPNPPPEGETLEGVQILRGNQRGVEVQRLSALTGVEQDGGLEIRVHEEIITQDEKIRGKRVPGEPEVRVRHGVNQQEWEDVKRNQDD